MPTRPAQTRLTPSRRPLPTRIRAAPGWSLSWMLIVIMAGGMSVACGGKPKGPASTLDAYSDALSKQKFEAAYDLMSSTFRARHTKAEFVRMMEENAPEARETAEQLRNPDKTWRLSAEFQYGLGDNMRLVHEHGAWRIASNPVQFYSQDTPRNALRSFIRAYRLRRWEIMLRFVPNAYRKRMDVKKLRQQFESESMDDIDTIMHRLEDSLDEPIHDNGNEARMTYGDGSEVEFIREDGVWKIQDLD